LTVKKWDIYFKDTVLTKNDKTPPVVYGFDLTSA